MGYILRQKRHSGRYRDWETFRDAFENVASNPSFANNLAPWQQSERIELLNPPRDSLASLFRGFIVDYFGGKK